MKNGTKPFENFDNEKERGGVSTVFGKRSSRKRNVLTNDYFLVVNEESQCIKRNFVQKLKNFDDVKR